MDTEVQRMMMIEEVMQLIYVDEQRYIVFDAAGEVSVELEEDGDTVMVHFNVEDADDQKKERHVYEVTMEPEHEAIAVYINGELVPFDFVIV